jgi:hypothetical protein
MDCRSQMQEAMGFVFPADMTNVFNMVDLNAPTAKPVVLA